MSITPRSSRKLKLLNSDRAPSPAVKRTMLDGVGCTTPTHAPAFCPSPLASDDEQDVEVKPALCACDCVLTRELQKLCDLQIGSLKFRMNASKAESIYLRVRVDTLERVVASLQQAVLQLQEQPK